MSSSNAAVAAPPAAPPAPPRAKTSIPSADATVSEGSATDAAFAAARARVLARRHRKQRTVRAQLAAEAQGVADAHNLCRALRYHDDDRRAAGIAEVLATLRATRPAMPAAGSSSSSGNDSDGVAAEGGSAARQAAARQDAARQDAARRRLRLWQARHAPMVRQLATLCPFGDVADAFAAFGTDEVGLTREAVAPAAGAQLSAFFPKAFAVPGSPAAGAVASPPNARSDTFSSDSDGGGLGGGRRGSAAETRRHLQERFVTGGRVSHAALALAVHPSFVRDAAQAGT